MSDTRFDIQFDKQDFTQNPLPAGDYDNCRFHNCRFSNTDLSHFTFSDCSFTDCDLSMVKTNDTAFRNTTFKGCKMLGVQFGNCNEFLFTVSFVDCNLRHASFFRLRSKKTQFIKCTLIEVDFSEADISGSVFDGSELGGAIFQNTILEKADFRQATYYSINPATNKIKKARFSSSGLAGLLDQYDIDID
jgi:fluoroquinolone resistance protein